MISEEIDMYIDTEVPSLIGNIFDRCNSKEEIFEAIITMTSRLHDERLLKYKGEDINQATEHDGGSNKTNRQRL